MKNLRHSAIGLIFALAFFFNIERLDFGGQSNVFNIHSLVYVVAFLGVLAVLEIPFFRRSNVSVAILFWIAVYTALKLMIFNDPPFGGIQTYLYITEITLPSILIWLAHQFARGLTDFEQAVEDITLGGQRLKPVEEATDVIRKELRISRRNQRPLSVMVVECESESFDLTLNRALQEVQRAIITRHSLLSLSRIVDRTLRCSDLIFEQRDRGRFIIICPETDRANCDSLAERIRNMAANKLGLNVTTGVACLPNDALTFEELVSVADGNRHHPGLRTYSSEDIKTAQPAAGK